MYDSDIPGDNSPGKSKMCRCKIPLARLWAMASAAMGFFCFMTAGLRCDAQDNWNNRGTFSNLFFVGITHGNGLFVAVGYENKGGAANAGAIMTSPNGIAWTRHDPGTADDLRSVTWGDGMFVAVGSLGRILTSADGVNWVHRNNDAFYTLNGVAYGNGRFVAVGENANVQTSSNGTNWTSRNLGTFDLLAVCYGNGLFTAVGASGAILISADGLSWRRPESGTRNSLYGVASGKGLFVAVGAFDPQTLQSSVLSSGDGIHWTSRTVPGNQYLFAVAYGNNVFAAVGDAGSVFTSFDGLNWTEDAVDTQRYLLAVAYGDFTFVAAGDETVIQSNPFTSLQVRRSGFAELIITGPVGRSYDIHVADTLPNGWRFVGTVTATSSPYSWIDAQSLNAPTRFYRTFIRP